MMTDKSVSKMSYLQLLQSRADSARALQKDGYILLLKKSWILFLTCGLALTGGFIGTRVAREKAYTTFQQTGEIVYEDMDIKDSFTQWNQVNNGNDINTLLGGGRILTRRGQSYAGVPVGPLQGKVQQLPASAYLNLVGSVLYYRDDVSRNIYALDLGANTSKVYIKGNVGEIFCSNDTLYYINHNQKDQIFSKSLSEDGEPQLVFAEPVLKFAVINHVLLVLQTDRKLFYVNGKTKHYLVDADDFAIVGGKIYAVNQQRIVRFNPSGEGANKVYEGADKLQLIGVSGTSIYFLENHTVKRLLGSSVEQVDTPSFMLANSLSTAEDGSVFFVGCQQGKNNLLEKQLIQVQ